MKKKILSLLLALALVMSLLPVAALASNVPEGSGVPDFSAFVGADELSVVLTEPEGYTPYMYDFATDTNVPGDPVPLYTLEIPEDAETVDLEFSANVLAYNYSPDGTKFIGGYYEDYQTGAATAAVAIDADEDGNIDCIQVQTPYAGFDTEVLYAITFRYPLPFIAASTDEWPIIFDHVTVKKDGYNSPYGDPAVTLYTVGVPAGTEAVKLSFNGIKVLAYNYSADDYISGAERYPGNDYLVGADTATVSVDAGDYLGNKDGVIDFIQVQTPYYEVEGSLYPVSDLLYAITFDDGSSGGGEGGDEPVVVTEAELLNGIASVYAEKGPGSNSNSPWVTADMMTYANLPGAQYRLTEAQIETAKNDAVFALSTTESASDAAKNIIALVAMGYDPTRLTAADGEAFSAKDTLDALAFTDSGEAYYEPYYEYALPYVIMAYRLLGNAQDLQKLVALALEKKDAWMDTSWGVDGMTPFMVALAPDYETDSGVKAALDDAIAAVKAWQLEDGSIASSFGPSAASTGLAIAGFNALGLDPHTIKNGDNSLIDGLLTFAIKGGTSLGSDLDTEQGFRGLVAMAKGTGFVTYTYDTASLQPAADLSIPSVTFNIQPSNAGAKLVFKDADGNEIAPVSAGVFSRLDRGEYSYTVTASGYKTSSGTVKVNAYSRETVYVSLVRTDPGGTPESDTAVVTVKVLSHDKTLCEGKYTFLHNPTAFKSILGVESYNVTLVAGQGTARDALVATLTNFDIPFTEESNGYFSMIGNETEMSHGSANSGWMYLVNGMSATVGAGEFVFNGDATMIWFFSDDYTNDYGSEGWGPSPSGAGKSAASSAEVSPAAVSVKPAVIGGEAKAEISSEDIANAIGKSKNADALDIKVETSDAEKVEVSLGADAIKAIARADMGLTVNTENGTVKVDSKTMEKLAEVGKDVAVTVTRNSDGSTTISVLAGGENIDAKIKVELPAVSETQIMVIANAEIKKASTAPSTKADIATNALTYAVADARGRTGAVSTLTSADAVAEGSGIPVALSTVKDGIMYAVIPAGATVKVVNAVPKAFSDVKTSDWFAKAVAFVTSHGIFQGTDLGFEPGATMNRAMLATVLYRIAGATGGGASTFADVAPKDWFADAVAWAADAGIVNGRGAGYAPDAPVTREEIATMLYRFVQYLGVDVSGVSADLSAFSDGSKTSGWASDAMTWAVGAGLFQGDQNGALNPTGEATRAEVAALTTRLVELIAR